LIKPVNVVFIFKKAIDAREVAANCSRYSWVDQIKVPSHHSTSHHPPERPSHKAMQRILNPHLPTGSHLGQACVLSRNEYGAVKQPTKQNRVSKPDTGK